MKKYLILFILLFFTTYTSAHELEVKIIDNKDNTITIFALLNTGESAAGVLIKLEDKKTKEVLFQKRLPSNNQLIVNIPKTAYTIIFDEGDDDLTIKEGIPPKEGFKKQKEKKGKSRINTQLSTSKAVTFSIIIAFLLLLLTIFISKKNTEKILKELQNKR